MNERVPCEFFLIRYVADAVRNEFVNIGVMLRPASAGLGGGAGGSKSGLEGVGGGGGAVLRFTRNWARVRCVDPEADTAMLEALEEELRGRLVESPREGIKPVLEVVEDSFSNLLQITPAKGCLAESLPAEVENLMRVYVEPRRQPRAAKQSGRSAILASMRGEFERAHVWELMQKRVPAARYTQAGDPLRIDCAYRPNGVIRMFQAVSLESDPEFAKGLAFSMAALREGVARVEGATLELTAVVEPLAQVEDEEGYRFAVQTLEAGALRVMTTGDLGRMAETAARELRVNG